jgi:hypothetical protein
VADPGGEGSVVVTRCPLLVAERAVGGARQTRRV